MLPGMNPDRGSVRGNPRWGAILTLVVLLAGAWQAPVEQPAPRAAGLPSAGEIDSILKELSDITGFRIRKQLPFALNPNGPRVAQIAIEVMLMDALIVSAAFAGSLGTAWMIQRAILTVCLKAIAPNRR